MSAAIDPAAVARLAGELTDDEAAVLRGRGGPESPEAFTAVQRELGRRGLMKTDDLGPTPLGCAVRAEYERVHGWT